MRLTLLDIRLAKPAIPHNDVIKWKHFPRYWSFVRGIHRSPVNFPHEGQGRGALKFSLICALNKRLSKQSWGWWFETPSRSLWSHCKVQWIPAQCRFAHQEKFLICHHVKLSMFRYVHLRDECCFPLSSEDLIRYKLYFLYLFHVDWKNLVIHAYHFGDQ